MDSAPALERLQKRFVNLSRGTIVQPVWDRLEQVGKEAQRAYSEGKDEEFRRLNEEPNQLGAKLVNLLETGEGI